MITLHFLLVKIVFLYELPIFKSSKIFFSVFKYVWEYKILKIKYVLKLLINNSIYSNIVFLI